MTSSDLGGQTYVNLETFRRDGTAVATPVWVAPLEGRLVIFTDGTSYKVKRVRRNPRVRIAACDMRGKASGPWLDGTATIVRDPEHEARAYAALRAKYGLQMRAIDLLSWLFGRIGRRVIVEVTPAPPFAG